MQAVASWKKSFVRSSTGEEDATSTTVAASAAGVALATAARRRRTTSPRQASDDAIEPTKAQKKDTGIKTRDLVGDAVGPLVRAQRLLGIDSE